MSRPKMVDGFPRRARIDMLTPAEAAIRAAVDAVERAGAHPLLTEAVILLSEAQERVADYVELERQSPQEEEMRVRAKMVLRSITDYGEHCSKTLRFETSYDEAIPEDRSFSRCTPSGSIEMSCDNPAALAAFQVGKAYYVDFIPAE
jgi:hypothetical protein